VLKDILVHVDSSTASARRLALAAALAEETEAHLTGLHVKWLQESLYWADPFAAASIIEAATETANAEAERAAAQFRTELAGRALAGEWRVVAGPRVRSVAQQGGLADLIVVGQHDPDNEAGIESGGLAEQVVLASGRPCLVVPYCGDFPTFGRRVLIAWNGSREAARAVNDALPFLKRAAKVHVVAVEPFGSKAEARGALPTDIAAHLARHGVTAEIRNDVAEDISVGDLLLSMAADLSVDLIVAGAYGHSRLRELVMGGVSRTVLAGMTVPVLMSH
jgi:nucleotide-binding universal stress UspA family protein